MEKICEDQICTGCGLCASECPQRCISMNVRDGLGHLFPNIDTSTCIDCGICLKKCPSIHPVEKVQSLTAFAAWSKNEDDYISSASGGVASVISHYVISQGGVVYGCTMMPNAEVKHIRVDKVCELDKLKGSKYVQSDIVSVIPLLKKDIKNDRLTLFIGTPCQVAAIKSIYKKQPEKLVLVDLICHGIPSLTLLQEHIKVVVHAHPPYDSISFRESGNYSFVVRKGGKVIYRQTLSTWFKEWYLCTFLDGYTFRKSCYTCQYACSERVADVTIGDFWGLGAYYSVDEIPQHSNGCSVILPITTKGEYFIDNVSSVLNLYRRPINEAIDGNEPLRIPVPLNNRRKCFRFLYPLLGRNAYYISVIDKYIRYHLVQIKKKILK